MKHRIAKCSQKIRQQATKENNNKKRKDVCIYKEKLNEGKLREGAIQAYIQSCEKMRQ